MGTYYLTAESEAPIDTFGGNSMIVDPWGVVLDRLPLLPTGKPDRAALRRAVVPG